MSISRDEIITVLRDEAINDPEVGWLSDMGSFDTFEMPDAIEVSGGGTGSIDLAHLASIVQGFMSSAWEEGRTSVAVDMLSPTDSDGVRSVSKNPYRS